MFMLTAYVATLVLVAVAAVASSAATPRCPGSPNQCSLHGSCVINRLGEFVCNCQWGYHGSDCAKKMCPHGVDPTTSVTRDKTLRLVVSGPPAIRELPSSAASQYALQGKLILTFHAHSVEMEMPLEELTSDACARVFRRFQNLASVSCERVEYKPPASAVYEVTLHAFPVYPVMNNLYRHDGNPSANEFWCDSSDVQLTKNGAVLQSGSQDIQCSFQFTSDAPVKPYAPCSSRGLCNAQTGLCTCDDGYYGDNCANNKDEEDILVAPSHGPFFQGNVLRVSAKRERSTEFNLIKADINGATVFSMDGTGDAVFHDGSVYVKDGDVVIQDGQLQIQKGGSLLLDGANIKLQNGHLHVVSSEPESTLSALAENVALLRLDMASATNSADFVRLLRQSSVVFRVTSAGTVVIHDGGVEVLYGGVKVHRGGLQVLSDGVRILQGGLEIAADGLQIRNGDLAVQSGSVSISSATATPIKTRKEGDAVLHVEGTRLESPVISAAVAGHESPSFEVLGSGETRIQSGGLKVTSGGVDIVSGGQTIQSGGLVVKSGGILVETGSVTTRGGFRIEDGGLHVQNDQMNGPVLSLSSSNTHYAGSMLTFAANQSVVPYRLIEALAYPQTDGIPDSVFRIDSDGHVTTQGDITTLANGRIISSGALVSEAQVVFSHIQILAGETISVPATNSYVQVTDDGMVTTNHVRLDSANAYAGQLLVLQNEDEQSLTGDVSVKPASAAIFVFDGHAWRALTAASFDTSILTGVTSLEAANDLNFGDIKLTVNHLQVASQRAGFVALYGKGGELTHDEQLTYDAVQGLLSVDKLDARRLTGRIDMTQSELLGVEIVGGHISNVNMTDIAMVEVNGELFVENQAYFGSGITVDGQVMGSGAYIDASDERFKQDIQDINGSTALGWLTQLQAVEYAYRTEDFPSRGFSPRREIGFVAQQVEAVIPQVVAEDSDGFKYVAYARVVPVVVEAVKALEKENQFLRSQVEELTREMQALRELVMAANVI